MKLTDTQLVILSAAAQREDHAIQLPATLKGGAAQKVLTRLLGLGLVEEVASAPGMPLLRRNQDDPATSLTITSAGLQALGMEPQDGPETTRFSHEEPGDLVGPDRRNQQLSDFGPAAGLAPREGTKLAVLVALLSRERGASLADMTTATGWLPHTARAALTGLRKRGYSLGRSRAGEGPAIYRISAELPTIGPWQGG